MPKLLNALRWSQKRSLCLAVPCQQQQWISRRAIHSAWKRKTGAILTPEAAAIEEIRGKIWGAENGDKRVRNDDEQAKKRLKTETGDGKTPIYQVPFTTEDIKNEERRPKHKVAVMIGYSGTGYKGMQFNNTEKTIEGDLFAAFVSAGAISKANSDDPKKSSFVRCARTDKGVHAAGNVVSLKLIVEDEDIVQKINDNLSPQIRVWGYERTVASFSCYQECNSRIYEYLIPTHAFLPPHPDSYLGRKLVQLAEEAGDSKEFEERQKEVSTFWPAAEEKYIQPVLDSLDSTTRALIQKALYEPGNTGESTSTVQDAQTESPEKKSDDIASPAKEADPPPDHPTSSKERSHLDNATRSLRAAYTTAKKAYRIDPARLARIRAVLARYVGTRNFHNYTVQKAHRDPSAKRVIKSFVVDPAPILIADTEWLSLKVHGQSFMMHQIRKMVSMAALIVRCGCDPDRAVDSYGADKISIPKAPGLGLLLERPVFDSYNERAATKFGRERIDFGKYEGEIAEFKKREIYERIFREEESGNLFYSFFSAIDQFKSNQFLYLSSAGIPASQDAGASTAEKLDAVPAAIESDSEADAGAGEG